MATTVKRLSKRFRRQARKQTKHDQNLRWLSMFPQQVIGHAGQIAALTTICDVLCSKVADLLGIEPKQLQEEIGKRAQAFAEQLRSDGQSKKGSTNAEAAQPS